MCVCFWYLSFRKWNFLSRYTYFIKLLSNFLIWQLCVWEFEGGMHKQKSFSPFVFFSRHLWKNEMKFLRIVYKKANICLAQNTHQNRIGSTVFACLSKQSFLTSCIRYTFSNPSKNCIFSNILQKRKNAEKTYSGHLLFCRSNVLRLWKFQLGLIYFMMIFHSLPKPIQTTNKKLCGIFRNLLLAVLVSLLFSYSFSYSIVRSLPKHICLPRQPVYIEESRFVESREQKKTF